MYSLAGYLVAPFTGAWIETEARSGHKQMAEVAPFTGAWIETQHWHKYDDDYEVAPFTGAWIETGAIASRVRVVASRSLHGSVD